MKARACAALALLGAVSAAGGGEPPTSVETVIIQASALDGVWKIGVPDHIGVEGVHAEWGDLRDSFCRIESRNADDVRIHCPAWPMLRNGTVSVEGTKIHLAWGSMMARIVMDGVVQSAAQFEGNFAFKFSGIRYDDPAPAKATRIAVSAKVAAGGDEAALLGRLLEASTHGTPSEASYTRDKTDVSFPKSEDLQALGPAQAIIYLGQLPYHDAVHDPHPKPDNHQEWLENQKARDFMSAYDVEFQNGQRICELHRQADERIDRFICV